MLGARFHTKKAVLAVHRNTYGDWQRKVLNAVAKSPESKSRKAGVGQGTAGNGDARRKPLFLFPDTLRDEPMVGYVLQARRVEAGPAPLATSAGGDVDSALIYGCCVWCDTSIAF